MSEEEPSVRPEPPGPAISFRRLTLADLPLLHRWLTTEHVRRWWDSADTSLEAVADEYAPLIEGREPTEPYLILYDGMPIGYVQTYLLRDHPDYQRHVGLGDDAAALDVFIGEPAYVYRGLGPRLLVAFLREVVFARPEVSRCLVGPAVSNASAIRAYAKAGFRHLRTVDVPGEAEPEYLMVVDREQIADDR